MKAQNYLRQNRKALRFTQQELANLTGFTQQMIADYETGRARTPGDLILKLQDLMKIHATASQ